MSVHTLKPEGYSSRKWDRLASLALDALISSAHGTDDETIMCEMREWADQWGITKETDSPNRAGHTRPIPENGLITS